MLTIPHLTSGKVINHTHVKPVRDFEGECGLPADISKSKRMYYANETNNPEM